MGRAKSRKQSSWRATIEEELRYLIPRAAKLSLIIAFIYLTSGHPKSALAADQLSQNTGVVTSEIANPSIGEAEISFAQDELAPTGLKVPILMYHYIENPGHDPTRDKMLVTPASFEAQLLYLKESGWTTITLDDLSAALRGRETLPAKPIILTFDDGYLDFYNQAWPIIKKYQVKATIYVMSRQESCNGDRSIYMTREMIKELAQSPLMTVASHTLNHCDLKAQNLVEQKNEILGSKIELEELIGRPVRHFAYPYGDFNEASLRLVQAAGYETATSTLAGDVHTEQNLFTLHRVRVGNFSPPQFEAILAN